MKKEVKYIIFLIFALILAFLVYYLTSTPKSKIIAPTNKTDIISEVPVVNEPVALTIPAAVDKPIYTKTIKEEMMSNAEKATMGISPTLTVQVLRRGEDGKVIDYRVITDTNPVLDKFGN